jgi:hypothetical protein
MTQNVITLAPHDILNSKATVCNGLLVCDGIQSLFAVAGPSPMGDYKVCMRIPGFACCSSASG